MKLQELFTEDRAVSPVIGVILMVAITVILAAVIGAFVLGLGDSASETAPSAQIDFDYDTDENDNDLVTLTHDGGNSFQASNVNLTGGGDSIGVDGWEGTISAGSSSDPIRIDDENEGLSVSEGETIRLVWQGDSGSSSTIARSTVPSGFGN